MGFCCSYVADSNKGLHPKNEPILFKTKIFITPVHQIIITIIAFFPLWFLCEVIRCDDIYSCIVEMNKAVMQHCSISQFYSINNKKNKADASLTEI